MRKVFLLSTCILHNIRNMVISLHSHRSQVINDFIKPQPVKSVSLHKWLERKDGGPSR